MGTAGIAVLGIGMLAARRRVVEARGLDRVLASGRVWFAVPLAVFGALHLFGPQFVASLVPPYMPWRSFWVYSIGCALIGASISIAINVGLRWSGLLFGILMYLFVAMIHLPGAIHEPGRLAWTIVFREMAFGGAGWLLAANGDRWPGMARRSLITIGRFWVTLAMIVFGVEHFLYPTLLPGVPLAKELPMGLPGRALIDYVTGAALLLAAGSVVVRRHTRTVLTGVGTWLLLLVFTIYGPVLVGALAAPGIGVQVEGINYFADTMLFTAAILALAGATPGSATVVLQASRPEGTAG